MKTPKMNGVESGYKYYYQILFFRLKQIPWQLRLLLGIFFSFICCYEYWLKSHLEQLSVTLEIISRLAYSYISAFIFYYLAVFLPKEKKRQKIYLRVQNNIAYISTEVYSMYAAIAKHCGIEFDPQQQQELKIDFDSVLPIGVFTDTVRHETFYNWFDYYNWKANSVLGLIHELLQYNDLLPSNLIGSLSVIESSFKHYSLMNQHNTMVGCPMLFEGLLRYSKKLRQDSKSFLYAYSLQYNKEYRHNTENSHN